MREPLNKIRHNRSIIELSPMYRHLHDFSLKPGYYLTSHTHSFYHVNLYLEGSVTFHSRNKTFQAKEGNLIICPPDIEHSLYTEHGYTQIGIDLSPFHDPAGLYSLFQSTVSEQLSLITIPNYKRYTPSRHLFHDFSELNRLKAIHYMNSILLAAISSIKKQASGHFKDAFLDIMNQPKAYNLSVTEISRRLSISKTHLERLTHREFSCSVKAYCNKLKLSLLRHYLEYTDMTSKELCEAIGFCDESHLTTFFKRHTGCTPREYKKSAHQPKG